MPFFHGKDSFADFCSLDISCEISECKLKGRTLYRPSPRLKEWLRFVDKVILRYLLRDEEVVHW